MRLHSRVGASAVDDPQHGHIEAGDDGGFDFPEALGASLHAAHSGGKPLWETDIERQARLTNEELERRKDPATLLAAVEQLVAAAASTAPKAAAKAAPAKAAASK